jgi:peroxiredoxin Q/BCP
MPAVGDPAPPFAALDTNGQPIALADFAGAPLVLYFYPKDDTSGCTAEACDFRDRLPDFSAVGAQVVGVSRDGAASHARFAAKYELPFRLIADTDEAVCRAYDVIKEKCNYGRKYLGIERTTYVIDAAGVIRAKFAKVTVKGHVAKVLAGLAPTE